MWFCYPDFTASSVPKFHLRRSKWHIYYRVQRPVINGMTCTTCRFNENNKTLDIYSTKNTRKPLSNSRSGRRFFMQSCHQEGSVDQPVNVCLTTFLWWSSSNAFSNCFNLGHSIICRRSSLIAMYSLNSRQAPSGNNRFITIMAKVRKH